MSIISSPRVSTVLECSPSVSLVFKLLNQLILTSGQINGFITSGSSPVMKFPFLLTMSRRSGGRFEIQVALICSGHMASLTAAAARWGMIAALQILQGCYQSFLSHYRQHRPRTFVCFGLWFACLLAIHKNRADRTFYGHWDLITWLKCKIYCGEQQSLNFTHQSEDENEKYPWKTHT